MKFQSKARQVIEDAGYKITKTRLQVIEALAQMNKPVSPYDLQRLIVADTPLNHVTIYRILEMLISLHLVHKVANRGFIRCEIPLETGCHHFVVCNKCGETQEFLDKTHTHSHLPKELEKKFDVVGHSYEVEAICKKCI